MSEQLVLENGAALTAPTIEQPSWSLDVENAIFTTSNGFPLQMKRPSGITSLVMERVRQQGKPKIPMVEVTIGGKYKQMEANPNDENYKALYAEWDAEAGIRVMRYIFITGLKVEVPDEYIAEQQEFFPDATANDFKYLFVASKLSDEDTAALTEAIISMNMPTAKGLQDSADSFRHNGQRVSG